MQISFNLAIVAAAKNWRDNTPCLPVTVERVSMQNLINLALVNIAAFLLLPSKYLKCASHTVRNVPIHLPPFP